MDRATPPTTASSGTESVEERGLGEFTRRTLIVVGLVALAALLWQVVHVLLLAFGGIVLAVVFRAFAGPLARWTGLPKSRATLIVVLLLTAASIGGGWAFGQQVTGQFSELWQNLLQAFDQARRTVDQTNLGSAVLDRIQSGLQNLFRPLATGALSFIAGLAEAIIVFAVAVYLALSPQTYRRGLLRLIPPARRDQIEEALDAAGNALRNWLLGQGVAMLGVGITTALGLWLVGVPSPIALGVIAALLDFVPFFGPIVAAIPGVLLGFQDSPQTALYAALVYLVVQQLEGNVLQPLAQRWAVHIPPALSLLAVVAFGLLFGIIGILFAVPLAVVVMVLVRKLYTEPLESRSLR
jgi:predicted PurR-regulated permease PerM